MSLMFMTSCHCVMLQIPTIFPNKVRKLLSNKINIEKIEICVPLPHLYIPQCTGKNTNVTGMSFAQSIYLCNVIGCLLMIENRISHRPLL